MLCIAALLLTVHGQRAIDRIKPGDVISVTVFGKPDYSGDIQVASDGTLSSKGFKAVPVSGLTLLQAEAAITSALKRVLKSPTVSLSWKEQAPFWVNVVGGKNPLGSYQFHQGMTVRQLISLCGLPLDPDQLEAELLRQGKAVSIDLASLVRNANQNDVLLEPDDVLVIRQTPYVRVWLGGEVTTTGEFKLKKGSDLLDAISAAGGPHSIHGFADELKVRLRRAGSTTEYTLSEVKQNSIALMDNDSISLIGPEYINVVIAGQVREPGSQMLRANANIYEAIALAKGLSEGASYSRLLIFRDGEMLCVDARSAENASSAKPFQLHANDLVYVPNNDRTVFVVGAVVKPGRITIPDAGKFRATEALALASGLTEKGSLRRMYLVRPSADGKLRPQQFNLDEFLKDGNTAANPELQPGDILFFTEPKGPTLETLNRFVSALFFVDSLFKR